MRLELLRCIQPIFQESLIIMHLSAKRVEIDNVMFAFGELRILRYLATVNKAVGAKEIYESCKLSKGYASERLASLQRKGLVRKEGSLPHPVLFECVDIARANEIIERAMQQQPNLFD